jgi:hypothetical protein
MRGKEFRDKNLGIISIALLKGIDCEEVIRFTNSFIRGIPRLV